MMIWQLAASTQLLAGWRWAEEPAAVKTAVLGEFLTLHHWLAFANRWR